MLSNTIIVLLIGRNMNYLSTCHQSSLTTLLNAISTATAIVGHVLRTTSDKGQQTDPKVYINGI